MSWLQKRFPRTRKLYLLLRWKIRTFTYPCKRIFKRTIHLYYRFRYDEYLRRVNHYFHLQDRAREKEGVPALFGTIERELSRVRHRMSPARVALEVDPRIFRAEFCRTVRKFRGLTEKNLCVLLNSRREIAVLDDKYCQLHEFYPFTADFIKRFELNILSIQDFMPNGPAAGAGFPTEDFTKLIAKACNADTHYPEFERWYEDYSLALYYAKEHARESDEKSCGEWKPDPPKSSLVVLVQPGLEG